MTLTTYRELIVWQRSVDLVVAIYELTSIWPSDERFGLISQARRAATSVPANIAEGYGRSHRGDYLRHLSFARGSLMELETHLIVASRLNMVEREQAKDAWELLQETGRLLNGHIRSLRIDRMSDQEDEPNEMVVKGPEPRTLNPEPCP